MFEGIEEGQLEGALEALLFVSSDPVDTIALASLVEVAPERVLEALVGLKESLERDARGLALVEVAGGWRLLTKPAFDELVQRYVLSWDTRRLSQAALEVLAIVAYAQPVTRAEVTELRGVSSDSALSTLLERGLVREAGTADTPGNPILYATSRVFLDKFGLASTADLPVVEQFAPDDDTRRLIRARLQGIPDRGRNVSTSSDAEAEAGDAVGSGIAQGAHIACEDDAVGAALNGSAPASPGTKGARMGAGATEDAAAVAGSSAKNVPARGEDDAASLAAAAFGLVEKIDFDALEFDTDDE